MKFENQRHKSTGVIKYDDSGKYLKAIVEIDSEIVEYYRHMMPKYIKTNKQMYSPHITFVRGKYPDEIPKNMEFWSKYEGEVVEFEYDHEVYCDSIYFWLGVFCDRLSDIREELGLSRLRKIDIDKSHPFHITIGNIKEKNG